MNKPWVVILVLIGIFAGGAVSGSFVTLRMCREKVANRPVPEEWAPRHLKKLGERLSLTPQQTEEVGPIITRNMELLARMRSQSMVEIREIVETMQRDIREKLTPEQRAKFEKMNRELREAREAREKLERAKREKSDGKRPGGPPPPDKAGSPPEKPAGS
jgi:Spy/CpxP family protein refolding chaperone